MLRQAGTHHENAEGGPALSREADLRYTGVPATAGQLPRIRHCLAAWARRLGASSTHAHEVVLATHEAMDNVVNHAYPHGGGTFDIHAAYRPDQGRLSVTVSDRGRWRLRRITGRHDGRGLRLIKGLAAQASVTPCAEGTIVQMSWPLPRS